MRTRLSAAAREHGTLFASIVKWSIYAAVVGALVGLGTATFLKALGWGTGMFHQVPRYHLFLPVTILASALLVRYLAPDAEGHGTERVIEAVHQRMGKIPLMVIPVKLLATVVTLAGGGSAGKEGPCAQIGAGLASGFADILRLEGVDRRKLVICGIGAGFATVFGTPIAGALFGVEVLVLGQIMYDVLFPSFVAGIVGYHVAVGLGITYTHMTLPPLPQLSNAHLAQMALLGLWCGVVALLLIELVKGVHAFFRRIPSIVLRALLGGTILAAIGALAPRYLGLGLDSIDAALNGQLLPAGAFLWKSIATAVTLGCGGSGGVVTPIFFVGSAAGNVFARLFDLPVTTCSCIGMAAVLAGAANTPIAACVLAMEMFGAPVAPYAAVACMVSFLMAGYRSIYPSQILGMQKSESLNAVLGVPIRDMGPIAVAVRSPMVATLVGSLSARERRSAARKPQDAAGHDVLPPEEP